MHPPGRDARIRHNLARSRRVRAAFRRRRPCFLIPTEGMGRTAGNLDAHREGHFEAPPDTPSATSSHEPRCCEFGTRPPRTLPISPRGARSSSRSMPISPGNASLSSRCPPSSNGWALGTNGWASSSNGPALGTNGDPLGSNWRAFGSNRRAFGSNGDAFGTNGYGLGTNGDALGTNGWARPLGRTRSAMSSSRSSGIAKSPASPLTPGPCHHIV